MNKETNWMRIAILFILLSMFVFGCSTAETNNTYNKAVSRSAKEDYYKEKILGTWIAPATSLTSDKDGVEIAIKGEGEDTYFRDGEADCQGIMSIEYPDDPDRGTVVFDIWGKTAWEIKGNFLYQTSIDYKFVPNLEKSTNIEAIPVFEDFIKEGFSKGFSSSSEIIKLDDKVCVTKDESDGSISNMTRKLETKVLICPRCKKPAKLGDKYCGNDGEKFVNSYASMKPDIDYEPKAILKDNSDAIKSFKEMIKDYPDDVLGYVMLGQTYSLLGLYKEAVKVYKQAIAIEPDNTLFHSFLGLVYMKAGMYKEAIDECKQAIRINPDSEDAHYRLGFFYDGMGMYKEAIGAYNQVIMINPDNADTYVDIGKCYIMAEMYKEAIKYCKQAIRINPDSSDAHYWLGSAYSGIDMYEEAIEARKQVIKINPDNVEAHISLGMDYALVDMYDEAEASFKQAIRIMPNNATAHQSLGACYLHRNDRGSALEEYKILKGIDAVQASNLFNMIYK